MIEPMYLPKAFSPETVLTSAIGAADTRIFVDDVSVFPAAPNFATLGTTEDGETVVYSAIGINYIDVSLRAAAGVAQDWAAGTIIARKFTAGDLVTLQQNIVNLNNDKLDKNSDIANMTTTFAESVSRTNIETGETNATIFGKIKKWFSDLKALAFLDTVTTSYISNSNVTNAKLGLMDMFTIKGNKTSSMANPQDLTASEVKSLLSIPDGADKTTSGLNNLNTVTTLADTDKLAITVDDTMGKKIAFSSFKTLLAALFANISHSHAQSEVTNLATDLSNRYLKTETYSKTEIDTSTVQMAKGTPVTLEWMNNPVIQRSYVVTIANTIAVGMGLPDGYFHVMGFHHGIDGWGAQIAIPISGGAPIIYMRQAVETTWQPWTQIAARKYTKDTTTGAKTITAPTDNAFYEFRTISGLALNGSATLPVGSSYHVVFYSGSAFTITSDAAFFLATGGVKTVQANAWYECSVMRGPDALHMSLALFW